MKRCSLSTCARYSIPEETHLLLGMDVSKFHRYFIPTAYIYRYLSLTCNGLSVILTEMFHGFLQANIRTFQTGYGS
jgi:hypothetical protein